MRRQRPAAHSKARRIARGLEQDFVAREVVGVGDGGKFQITRDRGVGRGNAEALGARDGNAHRRGAVAEQAGGNVIAAAGAGGGRADSEIRRAARRGRAAERRPRAALVSLNLGRRAVITDHALDGSRPLPRGARRQQQTVRALRDVQRSACVDCRRANAHMQASHIRINRVADVEPVACPRRRRIHRARRADQDVGRAGLQRAIADLIAYAHVVPARGVFVQRLIAHGGVVKGKRVSVDEPRLR